MSRRGAYLLVWGVAYAALGILLVEGGDKDYLWEISFVIGGLISIAAGLTRPAWLDRLGFVILSFLSTSRALAYVVEGLQSTSNIGNLVYLASALWVAVALSHVIVSGWPDKVNNLPWPEGAERRGPS